MRSKALKKKHTPVDKSVLAFKVRKRFRDEVYLKSFNGATCFACGIQDGTIVGAHIRPGWHAYGKPHDYWVMPLCSDCHMKEGAGPEKFWKDHGYTVKAIKKIAKQRYQEWLNG